MEPFSLLLFIFWVLFVLFSFVFAREKKLSRCFSVSHIEDMCLGENHGWQILTGFIYSKQPIFIGCSQMPGTVVDALQGIYHLIYIKTL